jgi:hypothetical protein
MWNGVISFLLAALLLASCTTAKKGVIRGVSPDLAAKYKPQHGSLPSIRQHRSSKEAAGTTVPSAVVPGIAGRTAAAARAALAASAAAANGEWFQCLDGSKTIPFERVNDDFCDCPTDGSDEPGT